MQFIMIFYIGDVGVIQIALLLMVLRSLLFGISVKYMTW